MALNERFVGFVVDVNDPEKAGRVKIRIYGMHDDQTRIPDDMLPWARCVFPVTNPVNAGIAGPTTGLVKNSTVVGYFADQYNQIPLVDGTLGSVGDSGSDFAPVDRGDDMNAVVKDSILHIGTAEIKFAESKTIGAIDYIGQDIGSMLNQIGQGDIRGALSSLTNVKNSIQRMKETVLSAPIEQLNSIIQGYASDLSQLAEDQLDAVITSQLGTVLNMAGQDVVNTSDMFVDNLAHLLGAIGTRKSKAKIDSIEDALNRISGARFTMANQIGAIDSALGKLRINMGK